MRAKRKVIAKESRIFVRTCTGKNLGLAVYMWPSRDEGLHEQRRVRGALRQVGWTSSGPADAHLHPETAARDVPTVLMINLVCS